MQDKNLFFAPINFGQSYEVVIGTRPLFFFLKFVFKEEIIKKFTIYEDKTTIVQPYIQLRRERNSCNNSENCIIITLIINTNFML